MDPEDWKPMKAVGPGVREIRIRDAAGAFRIIYLATLADRGRRAGVRPCGSDPIGAAGHRSGRHVAPWRLRAWKAQQ